MKLPAGITEEYFLETFKHVVKKLSFKFRFGSHEVADIEQEAFLLAVKCLKHYDAKRPLANFLYIHLRNRLYNFKRDNYVRLEAPCTRCPINAFLPPDSCSAYIDKNDCSLYEGWLNRNSIKRNLINVLEYGQVNAVHERNMGYGDEVTENINTKEILEIIDAELPISLRKIYLKMLSGDKVNKKDRELVENEVLRILKNNKLEL